MKLGDFRRNSGQFTVRDIGSMLAAKLGLEGGVELHSVRVRDRYVHAQRCWVPSRPTSQLF